MKTSGNTILITGGATGIGFALANAFINAGNEVIICGRREDKLKEAKNKIPEIHTLVCDTSKEKERESLFNYVTSNFKDINILINNAGIQRPIDLKNPDSLKGEDEIEVNLKSYIHLSVLFTQYFIKQNKESAIFNVSSGLGFIPIAMFPIYCATKAAIHSYSMSERHQLKNTNIKVFEIIPPIVDTELDHGRRPKEMRGIPPEEVAKATLSSMENNIYEIPVGMAKNLRYATGKDFDDNFNRMNH